MTPLSLSPSALKARLTKAVETVKAKGYEYAYCSLRIDTDDPDYCPVSLYYRTSSYADQSTVYQRIVTMDDLNEFEEKCAAICSAKEQNKLDAIAKLAKLKEDLEDLEIDEELILPIFEKIKEMSGSLLTYQPHSVETDPNPEKEDI